MAIDVQCRGCNANYRVKDDLAGRMAECKHCGQKFRVPYRSPVVRLGDEETLAPPPHVPPPKRPAAATPVTPTGTRNFVEYGLDPDDPTAPIGKPKRDRPRVQAGLLPDLVLDLWLPLVLMIVCYGITLYTGVNYILQSNGLLAGFILLFVVGSMFYALVIPMTMRMIEGASKTLDFEAPNAIWLHTAACIALPTLGMTVGSLRVGSVAALVAFGLIGFVVMIPLMALMFRVDILKGLQAALLAAMFYVLSLAATGAVIAALALWLMPLWNITRPWDEKPVADTIAIVVPTVAATEVPKRDSPPADAAVVTEVVATPEPAAPAADVSPNEPPPPTEPWDVVVDSQGALVRLPAEVHHAIPVRPPVTILDTGYQQPYAAVVDQDALRVFDLRSGERLGTINERPRGQTAAVSQDGAFIAFEVAMVSSALPPSIEVWSVKEGRMVLRVPAHGAVRALGFNPSGRLFVLNAEEDRRVVQGWDVHTRRQVSSTAIDGELHDFALSANARLLAVVRPGQLQVYDLLDAKLVGRRAIEPGFQQVAAVAFSPDGKRLIAAVSADGSSAPRVLVWDVTDGTMQISIQLTNVKSSDLATLQLQWLPEGDAFLCNDEIIDTATGRGILRLPPVTAFGVAGRPRFALPNCRVLYEVVPSGQNERLIYRVNSLPRAEVVAAMKAVRGEEWEPPAEADALPASLALDSRESAPEGPAAATTRRTNPAMLREWDVAVIAVTGPDGPSLERQIRAAQIKLRPLEEKHRAAESRADALAGEYVIVRDANGRQRKDRRFSAREISEAKGAAKRALEDVRDVRIEIARLERELRSVSTVRTATGTLDDGTPTTLIIDNAAHAQLLDALTAGAKVKVTGGPLFRNGALEVKVRTLALVE